MDQERIMHVLERKIRTMAAIALGATVGLTAITHRGSVDASGGKEIAFTDVDGRAQQPLSHSERKATVLFFLLPDCPVSNSYAPEIQRICNDYEKKKIAAFIVHADPDVDAEQAKKHAKEYGLK